MVSVDHLERRLDTQQPLAIYMLGGFRLLSQGRPIPIAPGSKLEVLLTILALRSGGSCISRDTLLTTLWPNQNSKLAGQSLNSLIYNLRKQLEPELEDTSPILCSDGCYRLNYEHGICNDVFSFDALVRAGNREWHDSNLELAVSSYIAALTFYRGDLCGGSDWYTTIERERLRISHLMVLARVADYHYDLSNYEMALHFGQRMLISDPCREDAHRIIMRCHLRLGQRAEALRQYQFCAQVLRAEFDACPEAATETLYTQLRLHPESI